MEQNNINNQPSDDNWGDDEPLTDAALAALDQERLTNEMYGPLGASQAELSVLSANPFNMSEEGYMYMRELAFRSALPRLLAQREAEQAGQVPTEGDMAICDALGAWIVLANAAYASRHLADLLPPELADELTDAHREVPIQIALYLCALFGEGLAALVWEYAPNGAGAECAVHIQPSDGVRLPWEE